MYRKLGCVVLVLIILSGCRSNVIPANNQEDSENLEISDVSSDTDTNTNAEESVIEDSVTEDSVTEELVMNDDNLTFRIVDTGQTDCYDVINVLSAYPEPGDDYYGQDAQYNGFQPSYTLSDDGKTVYDHVTQLTWQSSPNSTNTIPVYEDKKTVADAQSVPDELNAIAYGGYTDWRLPTIKEMYSLILFSGKDISGYSGTDTSVLTPFIDTNYFKFSYGDIEKDGRLLELHYISL